MSQKFPELGEQEFHLDVWSVVEVQVERRPFLTQYARLVCGIRNREGEVRRFALDDAEVFALPPLENHGSLLLLNGPSRGWDTEYPFHLQYVAVDGDVLPLARSRNFKWLNSG